MPHLSAALGENTRRQILWIAVMAAVGHWCATAKAWTAEPRSSLRVENAAVTALHEAVVSAAVAGPLVEMAIKEGTTVSKDALLARVHDAEARLEVAQAGLQVRTAKELATDRSGVQLAEKELELALSDLSRSEDSNRQIPNSVTAAKIEQLQLLVERERFRLEKAEQELKLAEIGLDLAESQLKLAEERLNRHAIRSPLDGEVVAVFRRQGEWVQTGEPVVRILQTKRLRVEAFVEAEDIALVAEGTTVTFVASLPSTLGDVVRGRVTYVSPESNPVNGQVRIVAEIDNPRQTLRTGSVGVLTIHSQTDGR